MEAKTMDGQYLTRASQADVDNERTHQCLRSFGLKAETEGLIAAAQDQSPAKRSHHDKITNDGTNPKCRL